ncbi:MAG: ABC transporter permease [Candidatus Saccharimonadales bacterium]
MTARNQAILREIVRTDFKVRYQGSVLGYVWAVLKPLLMFAVLYILFTYIAPIGKDVEHYGVSLLIGVVLWNFFQETTMMGASSIVENGDLIRKISIPRYLIVIARSVSALINLGLSLIVVVIFALMNGIMPSWLWLLIIPVIIELYVFSLGVAFVLATALVKFRDITYIWEVFLQAGFYASAIMIPVKIVPVQWHDIFFMNPIVQIVQDARAVIIPSEHNITIWNTVQNYLAKMIPFLIITAICVTGVLYFRNQSKYFAEDV